MNLLSLYSGIGALDLSTHWAGMNVVAMCEADPFCRSVLSRHWPEVPIFESDEHVTKQSLLDRGIDRIDIVAGGPPCQPFSVAGKQAGVADPRHRWPEMARIVAELQPRWVVVENVGGFLDVAKPVVLPDLESLGYDAWAIEIPAAAVGAPHGRARIFIVAYAAGARCAWREDAGADSDDARQGSRRVESERDGGERGAVADADGLRGSQPEGLSREDAEIGRSAGRSERRYDGTRALESRLGGAAARTSDWLDATRWPAPRFCPQYDYEPPRVTTERDLRRKRVKALGNACPPQQYPPIFALIVELEQTA